MDELQMGGSRIDGPGMGGPGTGEPGTGGPGMEQKRLFWVRGVIAFAAAMAALIFIGAPLQFAFGIWGLLLSELILLAVAVAAALVIKLDFKQMLRIKAPRAGQILGIIIMAISGMAIGSCATYIMLLILPQAEQTLEAFAELYSSAPGLVTWLIVAVSPAICEEVLHRGVILNTFERSGFKGKWPIVLCMGLIFGIFHLDSLRFFATAILGMILAYVMLETKNFLLPVLYHMLNNSLSVLAGLLQPIDTANITESLDMAADLTLSTIGTVMIMAAFALLGLRLGARLLGPKESSLSVEEAAKLTANRKKTRALTAVASILLFVAGVVCVSIQTAQMLAA